MRIALIAPEIPDYSIEFATILASSNDVLLCIADKHFQEDRVDRRSRLEVVWLPWPRQRELRNVIFVNRLLALIRSWRPDIVHFLNETNVWLNVVAAALKNVPLITTVHDVQLHPGDTMTGRIPRVFPNTLARQSDAVVVHGPSLRQDIIRTLSLDPEKVFVLPHPPLRYFFDIARERQFSKFPDGLLRVLFYGRIHEYKGLEFLLKAAPIVHAAVPNFRLVIAGRGDDFERYRSFIESCDYIETHIRFLSAAETAQLFSQASLLALPYIEASQSGVLMIGLPFGLPAVATDVGDLGYVVRALKIGEVLPPRDVPALASALIESLTNENLRKKYRHNAAEAMAAEYSRDQLLSQATSIYKKVAGK